MTEIIVANGLVLVIEGLLYALFPASMKKMMTVALQQPEAGLRQAGLIAAVIGVAIIYLIK